MSTLHLREAGSGPPLVLLHGLACHGGFFAEQIAALAARHRVLAPDLPGHGGSAAHGARTVEAAAEAVCKLLDDRDLGDATLVGWSMGAQIAYAAYARDRGARIGRLVIVDMTPKMLTEDGWSLGVTGGLDRTRAERAARAMEADWRACLPAVAANMFAAGREAPEPLRRFALEELSRADGAVVAALWRSLTEQDFRPLLPTIAVPVAIVHGAQSRIYGSAVARYQAEAIPQARLVAFAGSGHSPHLEEPAAFTRLLAELCPHP